MNYIKLKRMLDLILALSLMPFFFIVFILTIPLVLIVDFGSPLYFQNRIGYKGVNFKLWKIRSMYINSDQILEDYLRHNPHERLLWEKKYKLDNDPRVLPIIGKLVRATGIDEFPQIINIIVGDMGFIGPRPLPSYHIDNFIEDFINKRNNFRPGMTGLWQISPKRTETDCSMQELDQVYMNNISFGLDLKIFFCTIIYCISAGRLHVNTFD
jgi:lipopolysaccharide/colanic/teichoic acid biosynthesis glycosyltransferase